MLLGDEDADYHDSKNPVYSDEEQDGKYGAREEDVGGNTSVLVSLLPSAASSS